ncbi:beta-lactamase family protein [Rhodococcus triatomae]|nr:beta-lactamase family protein [Rhodococcus triatomae]QNG25733.1 beta-lactamase family protein [Rhodococcus triatomae]
MVVDQRLLPLADRFFSMYRNPQQGGGALVVYVRGEKVLDVWAGWADRDRRWSRDTVALSFSTGKGVASTVVHRLAQRGVIDYDLPLARYWPEFAAHGKSEITVRQLLTHRAGLHRVRGLLSGPFDMLDYDTVIEALANARPDPRRLNGPGYHAVTYGWLVAELVARATGKPFQDVVAEEIAGPLGIDEYWYRVPEGHRGRIAKLFPHINPGGLNWQFTSAILAHVAPTRGLAEAAMPDGFDLLVRSPRVHDAVMPGWNGVFSADAVARMYGAIANGGEIGGRRFLDPATIEESTRVQARGRDYVLAVRPNWSLGYHRPILASRVQPQNAIGHYGVGGSGGFADLDTGMSLGFVTNRLGSSLTALGDLRLARLGAMAQTLAQNWNTL